MIDFETELRDRFDRAADGAPTGDGLLPVVERRAVAQGRRVAALRVAAVVAALGLAAGGAVALTPDGDGEPPTRATDPDAPGTTTTAPALAEATGTWATMADAPVPGRFGHLSLAMGDEVLVWGGQGFDGGRTPGGAVYDVPTDSWRTTPNADNLSSAAVGVWTGEVAIVVGGPFHGGAGDREARAFDPATDTWTALATPPVGNVTDAVTHAVWTGTEMVIVTGGASTPDQVDVYDPATDTWRAGSLPETPLPAFAEVAWTGSEVVVVGYDSGIGDQPYAVNGDLDGDGDLMDPGDPPPVADSPTAGQTVVHVYDPVGDTWRALDWQLPGEPPRNPVAIWAGDALFVGGGGPGNHSALVDVATGTWTPVPDAPAGFASTGRHPGLWTGTHVLVPTTASTEPDQRGPLRFLAFDPATQAWSEGPSTSATPPQGTAPVWSAGRVVAPLGGEETDEGDGVISCCDHGPTGGLTYTP